MHSCYVLHFCIENFLRLRTFYKKNYQLIWPLVVLTNAFLEAVFSVENLFSRLSCSIGSKNYPQGNLV